MNVNHPRISVVIPSYNQSRLLAATLRHLARQDLAPQEFEVIVADDGSSDDTRATALAFDGALRLKYAFQEDRGFRAAAARNLGAHLADAPLLAFLDTGSLVGPRFLAHHLAAHRPARVRRAVQGISYGYNPEVPMEGVDRLLERMAPEQAVAEHGDRPEFQDIRHSEFVECGFDLSRRAVPWMLFWTGNCSLRTEDFRRLGGFDEMFRGWGGEDMELGRRLYLDGVPFALEPRAWAVVAPHERDVAGNDESFKTNMGRFLDKYPDPVVELGWGVTAKYLYWPWEAECRNLYRWTEKVAGLDVAEEIAALSRDVRDDERVAVIGCGGRLPPRLRSAILIDFDDRLLGLAVRGGDHTGHHAIGIRTAVADDAVDTVIVTSRVAGFWESWNAEIRAEAARISRRAVFFEGADDPAHS